MYRLDTFNVDFTVSQEMIRTRGGSVEGKAKLRDYSSEECNYLYNTIRAVFTARKKWMKR